MADYPDSFDNLADDKTNATVTEDDHPDHHNALAAALNAVQQTLGLNPEGGASTVAERMDGFATGETFTVGMMIDFALTMAQAPAGWLGCDGSAVTVASGNIALRNALIAAGNPYGVSGPDPLLPDCRGKVTAGKAAAGAFSTLGATLGTGLTDVQLGVSNLPAHTHTTGVSVTEPNGGLGHRHTGTSDPGGTHSHQPGSTDRSFVTATTASLVNVAVNSTSPDNVTRWVAGSSGGTTVQQLDLGVDHSIVVAGPASDSVAGGQQNNATTNSAPNHQHTFTSDYSVTGIAVNVTVSGGGSGAALGAAFSILQPTIVVNKIIKT